jgi:geranylgeranyl diphosphate synthase type II
VDSITRHTEYCHSLRSRVDASLLEAISGVQPPHLNQALRHAIAGGKRVRPLVLLTACAAAGGDEEDALDAAAALELLHTSSLIHDDIMDQSVLRRGRPTVHALYGISTAILAGDTLIALAMRSIHKVRSPRKEIIIDVFTRTFLQTCEGQGLDLALSGREDIADAAHAVMVESKTAKLVESCAAIGALIGTGDDTIIDLLKRYALNVGMAYQIRDDLLDVIGDQNVTGKPSGLDRRNQRSTYVSQVQPDRDQGSRIRKDVAARLSDLITHYTDTACVMLEALPAVPGKEYLRSLAGALSTRVM